MIGLYSGGVVSESLVVSLISGPLGTTVGSVRWQPTGTWVSWLSSLGRTVFLVVSLLLIDVSWVNAFTVRRVLWQPAPGCLGCLGGPARSGSVPVSRSGEEFLDVDVSTN